MMQSNSGEALMNFDEVVNPVLMQLNCGHRATSRERWIKFETIVSPMLMHLNCE